MLGESARVAKPARRRARTRSSARSGQHLDLARGQPRRARPLAARVPPLEFHGGQRKRSSLGRNQRAIPGSYRYYLVFHLDGLVGHRFAVLLESVDAGKFQLGEL